MGRFDEKSEESGYKKWFEFSIYLINDFAFMTGLP